MFSFAKKIKNLEVLSDGRFCFNNIKSGKSVKIVKKDFIMLQNDFKLGLAEKKIINYRNKRFLNKK